MEISGSEEGSRYMSKQMEKQKVVEVLNRILELELAGVVRYTHYSLMVFGFTSLPPFAMSSSMSWMTAPGPRRRKYRLYENWPS